MSICNGEIDSNIIFNNSKIEKIFGGDDDDVISLKCLGESQICSLTINEVECELDSFSIKSPGLEIDAKGGNNTIYLDVSNDAKLMGVHIIAKNGGNKIFPKLKEPNSSGIITLGAGENHIFLDGSKDSVCMVKGFRNTDMNKIHLHANETSIDHITFEEDVLVSRIYTMKLDDIPIVKLLNGHSLKDLERMKNAEQESEIAGAETSNKEFIMAKLPLINEILTEQYIVFEPQ